MDKGGQVTNSLIVHGGAWNYMSDDWAQSCKRGCHQALLAGWDILSHGGPAVDAVEKAVSVLEDDPGFDAGRGAFLNSEGIVELDASIMDGADLSTGAVAAVQRIRHPISLAKLVLRSDWAFLVGDGALRFARAMGMEECSQWDLVTDKELERWRHHPGEIYRYVRDECLGQQAALGTVGAVAIDSRGNIAAGTSTGGFPNKCPGRVGDSPLIGCGTYADNLSGGASTTGPGEQIIKVVLAKHAVDQINGHRRAHEAAQAALDYLQLRVGSKAGITVIDRWGGIGCACTARFMSYAYMSDNLSEPVVGV